MKSEHAKRVAADFQKILGSNEESDAVWGFIEVYSTFLDGIGIPFVGTAATVASILNDSISGITLLDNPYFIGNGQGEDDPSRITAKYLKGRKGKNVGSSAAGVAGGIASAWTAVDVAGIGLHGNAVGTTSAHLLVLRDLAAKSRKGGSVANWLDLIIRMKALKLTARTSSLVGASVPIPSVGFTTGLIATAIATGAKLTLSKACTATAIELHWRAKQEQFMAGQFGGGKGGSVGPASRIVWELFTKRGMTIILGKHDIAKIVQEPAGWMAINDKLLLI